MKTTSIISREFKDNYGKRISLRVWPAWPEPGRAVTLPSVLVVARALALKKRFPVLAEAGKTMFRVLASGQITREPGGGLRGPRKKLP